MRARRWILVISLLVAFTALVIYHGWNLFKINERIKSYVLEQLRPVLGAGIQIQKLDMSLGAVHFKGVTFQNDDVLIKIQDIRIGFNFTQLIKNKIRLHHIPHDVLLIQPELVFLRNPLMHRSQLPADISEASVKTGNFWTEITAIDFLKRITLSRGKIGYLDSLTHQNLLLAKDLNGWLSSSDSGSISIRFVGKLFRSDNYNLLLNGMFNVTQQSLDWLDATITNFEWKDRIPLIVPDVIDISRGRFNAAFALRKNVNGPYPFHLLGTVSLTDGAIHIAKRGLYFDEIQLHANLKQNDFVIDQAECRLNGSRVVIEGQLKNIFAPILDFTLSADEFDWQENMRRLSPGSQVRLRGKSQFVLKITDHLSNPVVTGQIWSQQIMLHDFKFQDVRARLIFDGTGLGLDELTFYQNGFTIYGHGRLFLSDSISKIALSLSGDGSFPILFPSLSNNHSKFTIQASGDFSELSGKLMSQLQLAKESPDPIHISGNFKLAQKSLVYDLRCLEFPCRVDGMVAFDGQHPNIQIQLNDVHRLIYHLPELRWVQKILNYKNSSVQIQKERSGWKINGNFIWPEISHRVAMLNCRINPNIGQLQALADFDVESNGERFHGQLDAFKTREKWQIRSLGIDDLFEANIQIHLTGPKQIAGKLHFLDFSLSRFARLISREGYRVNSGRVQGDISIAGQVDNIELGGKIDFNEIRVNEIGSYHGICAFQLVDRVLKLVNFVIHRDGTEIFHSHGEYSFATNQLDFDCIADHIDLNTMTTILFNESGIIGGKGRFQIKLKGDGHRPNWWGTIDVKDGKLGPFGFNTAQFELAPSDSVIVQKMPFNGIMFKKIYIARVGEFELTGNGHIPFPGSIPMDINLEGRGNILALLPDLTSFFKKTASDSRWSLTISGRPNNITISRAKLDLTQGYLRLGDVAPEINNIVANLELEQDGFLNVKSITGKIKGREFSIRNMRVDSLRFEESMTPFTIPELGLSFGVFAIKTSAKGIPLHIPALMEKGEVGQFVLSGKTDHQPFLIAGPLERPLVQGKIILNNVNFTFPFLVSEAEDTSRVDPVVEVLTQINWNVRALVGKDAHYQRQIPSGVDRVYVDLILDAGVGGLDFKGVIKDRTFGVTGSVESSRGNIEYLDLDFEVVKAGAEFDMDVSAKGEVEFDKSSLLPIVYGEGRTTVTDSTGYPYYIYLTLLTVDKETGQTLKRGRLGEVVFQLSADNPNLGHSEGELLASLGYSLSNMPKVATDIIGISADNLIFRPLFRPFERQLERALGLDIVRFSSRLTRNLIEMNLNNEQNWLYDSRLFLLRSTKLILGKYLAQRLFLLYTGQLEAGMHYRYEQEGLGLHHTLGLEYRINPNLLLEMQYDYNSLLLWQKEDKRIMLRHSFPF
ncbi:MAG: translocation/assembly module TamB [candidate division KSB1 bacterium]|nr:translocation/assembly module TamB [candidate division KSB1 bacterium]MDZ7334456.1 translocation/assembly module TamB [candidate division KSB1 bacterium]MDZ7355983.1 translocation/assembly module TamB [candidate division KSB1 bacterium]MDZ7400683.1 translocation/assembly module TamB [candidate division KSB1 bacterium]